MTERRVIALVGAIAALAFTAPALGAENRCGILTNPTPANWWLIDRDGEWTIGAQGGYQAEGIENIKKTLHIKCTKSSKQDIIVQAG